MAQIPLTPEQHRRLVRLIAARAGVLTPLQRENLLERAGLLAFRKALHFDTSPQDFSQQLVRVLQDHGTLKGTGQPALASLLRDLREIVAGHEDEAAFVDSLLALSPQRASTPRPAPSEPPLPGTPPGTARRPDLDAQAERNARRKLWGFLVLLGVAWAGIVVGIALFGWDVMEPVTFVVGGTLTLGGYAYFALTLQELSPAAFYTRLVEQERRRLYARQGLDPDAHGQPVGILPTAPRPAEPSVPPPQVPAPPPVSQRALEEAYLDLRCRDEVAQDFASLDAHVSQAGTGQVQRRAHRVEMRPLFRHRPELARLQEVAEERLAPPERETREYTDIIRAIAELRRVVLLGEPGAGKTTTLRKLEMDRIERARRDPAAPIPLFVPLGRWTQPGQSLRAFTAAQMGALGEFLDSLLAKQRAVLLLDGLDQIPPAQREAKARQVKALFKDHPALISVVSCREQDYTLDLGFDRLVIVPLDPARIREFAHKCLGQEEGERFFWRLAGGDEVREVWLTWERAGATWEQFWHAPDIPRESPNVYSKTTGAQDAIWREKVRNPASLMTLAGNAYMLSMLVAVYQIRGELPANRGRLFAEFVATLLVREELATRDEVTPEVRLSPEAEALLAALARLGYEMQVRRAQETGEGSAVTVLPRAEVVPALLSERQLYLGGSTNILSAGEEVRFSHQLLQEYFAATFMQGEIAAGRLRAEDLWPREQWWERTNWEEATVLLAGLHSDDCTPVLEWVAGANPEVAAGCIARSGAATPPATLARLRERWLPRLSDLRREPDPRGRAAVGRALDVAGLDDRRGVGLRADGLPEIVWVQLPGGRFPIGGDEEAYNSLPAAEVELPALRMARYPITNRQFRAFVEAADGYRKREWWQGLAEPKWDPVEPYFPYGNQPRETVNWYEAVAFCRWLSARLGYEVRLPTEQEWERAARGAVGRFYPWSNEYVSGSANIDETARFGGSEGGSYFLGQTSAVGIYPQGATPEGIEELAGNVREWTLTEWERGRNDDLTSPATRVVRGCSWSNNPRSARAASRGRGRPGSRNGIIGIRVVSPVPGRRMNSAADRQNPLKTG